MTHEAGIEAAKNIIKETWNTSISEVPEDLLKRARTVSREMNLTGMDGLLKPEHHIALALWNERLGICRDNGT